MDSQPLPEGEKAIASKLKEELIESQKQERDKILQEILESKAKRKIIVSGAGTGKSYTFRKILQSNPDGVNIAMTFIRLLRNDMEDSLGVYAEVKTFHEFCKKILHENKGGFLLYPKLTHIIENDARYLNIHCENFNDKFRMLDESGNEIAFYIKRGDYYNCVAFDDSVYRMLMELKRDEKILSPFDQILIDEFQDFNPLEVAFIDELEKKGNILIVGDDDQAVYNTRFSTPHPLREKFNSGKYEKFILPFCARCTEAIVNTTNELLRQAEGNGNLKGRLPKRYECFIELKDQENLKYPQITTAQITNVRTVIKFIRKRISEISPDEIAESWKEGSEYPTVLIVSKTQYLNPVFKSLKEDFKNIKYKQSEKNEIKITDAYDFLIRNSKSNLGWRILINFLMKDDEVKAIVEQTDDKTTIITLLSQELVTKQQSIVDIIAKLNREGEDNNLLLSQLEKLVDKRLLEEIKSRFVPEEKQEIVPDKDQPSILLTSYQGCKGMSAGFVFIIGTNNGVMPADERNISDVEICQFIVALTRTRKKCYILSEDRMYGPKTPRGNFIPPNKRSVFIKWIPKECLEDLGHLTSPQIG